MQNLLACKHPGPLFPAGTPSLTSFPKNSGVRCLVTTSKVDPDVDLVRPSLTLASNGNS